MRTQSFLRKTTILILILAMCHSGWAQPYIHDGETHDITWIIAMPIAIDYGFPAMRTTLNFLPGGGTQDPVHSVEAHEDSTVNLLGGTLAGSLNAHDRSILNIFSGSIGNGGMTAFDTSRVTMSGGYIGGGVVARYSSTVDIFGGVIRDWLWTSEASSLTFSGGVLMESLWGLYAQGDSCLTILGSDFAVDGQPFGFGVLTSFFGASPEAEPPRFLTGILANGDPLANNFYIGHEARIVLAPVSVPEPAIPALVSIDSGTLNLKSSGKWVTSYIELPDGYDVHAIDIDSVLLEGLLDVQHSDIQGDVLMVKFDREALVACLEVVLGVTPPADVDLTVSGELSDGTEFTGGDTIRITSPSSKAK